eukprot:8156-Heterococcus_DN1.PRE.2
MQAITYISAGMQALTCSTILQSQVCMLLPTINVVLTDATATATASLCFYLLSWSLQLAGLLGITLTDSQNMPRIWVDVLGRTSDWNLCALIVGGTSVVALIALKVRVTSR